MTMCVGIFYAKLIHCMPYFVNMLTMGIESLLRYDKNSGFYIIEN